MSFAVSGASATTRSVSVTENKGTLSTGVATGSAVNVQVKKVTAEVNGVSVEGEFSPTTTEELNIGETIDVIFTPTETTKYNKVTVTITIGK